MNSLAFIASIIGSLAWPAVVMTCLILLVKHGSKLQRLIKTIRYGDIELTLKDARLDAEAIAIERGQIEQAGIEPDDSFLRLAETHPALAIIDIWKLLEMKLIELIQHNGMMRFTRPDHFVKVLCDKGKITKSEVDLYKRLRNIRNEAIHSRNPRPLTTAEVVEYRAFVQTFIQRLEQIRNEPGYIDVPLYETTSSTVRAS